MAQPTTAPAEGGARPAPSGGSPFTRKLGPMPTWAWMAVVLGLALVYSQWRKNKAASTAAAASTTAATTAGQTPPFIIQNYVPGMPQTPTTPTPPGTVTPTPQGPPSPPIQGGHPPTGPHPPVPVPPATPGGTPTSTPGAASATSYRVKTGDTLSSIAAKYHTTWQNLWAYNTTPGNRPASTIATLKQRGPNLLFANEEILIPPSS